MAESRYKETLDSLPGLTMQTSAMDGSKQQFCDLFDAVMQCAKSLGCVSEWAYALTLAIESQSNHPQSHPGLPCCNQSKYLKLKVKRAEEAALLLA